MFSVVPVMNQTQNSLKECLNIRKRRPNTFYAHSIALIEENSGSYAFKEYLISNSKFAFS